MPSGNPTTPPPKWIAVMGATGTGKSSFIKAITKDSKVEIGHKLESETSTVRESHFVAESGEKVVFIDTPGFEDSRDEVSDVDILQMVVNYLQAKGLQGKVNGILYLHRISDPRVTKASRKNLDMFKALCGESTLHNVVLATTYWDSVPVETGELREKELRDTRNLFQQLLSNGAKLIRHNRGDVTAKEILNYLLPKAAVTPQIVREIREGKAIQDTAAGSILTEQIKKLTQKYEEELIALKKDLSAAVKKKDDELRQELELDKKDLQGRLERVLSDQKKLADQAAENQRKFAKAQADWQKQLQEYTLRQQAKEKEKQQEEKLRQQKSIAADRQAVLAHEKLIAQHNDELLKLERERRDYIQSVNRGPYSAVVFILANSARADGSFNLSGTRESVESKYIDDREMTIERIEKLISQRREELESLEKSTKYHKSATEVDVGGSIHHKESQSRASKVPSDVKPEPVNPTTAKNIQILKKDESHHNRQEQKHQTKRQEVEQVGVKTESVVIQTTTTEKQTSVSHEEHVKQSHEEQHTLEKSERSSQSVVQKGKGNIEVSPNKDNKERTNGAIQSRTKDQVASGESIEQSKTGLTQLQQSKVIMTQTDERLERKEQSARRETIEQSETELARLQQSKITTTQTTEVLERKEQNARREAIEQTETDLTDLQQSKVTTTQTDERLERKAQNARREAIDQMETKHAQLQQSKATTTQTGELLEREERKEAIEQTETELAQLQQYEVTKTQTNEQLERLITQHREELRKLERAKLDYLSVTEASYSSLSSRTEINRIAGGAVDLAMLPRASVKRVIYVYDVVEDDKF